MKRILILFIIYTTCGIINISFAYANSTYDLMVNSNIYINKEWLDLLHFENGKSTINNNSTFFISNNGYKDAKEEYIATINSFFDETRKDDTSTKCMYPARTYYILEQLSISLSELPTHVCNGFEEYLEKVPINSVKIIFAAEDNRYPASILGHSFIKLQGHDKNEQLREHAFSFFAVFQHEDNILLNYAKAAVGGTNGIFSLSPYSDKISEYLYEEKRSLWEFELKLSEQEIKKLQRHLWELKDHKINYSFTSHNCNDALISILNVTNNSFNVDRSKFFITPLEYLDALLIAGNINSITILPSDTDKIIIDKYGISNILNTPKSTRISLSFEQRLYSYLNFDFQLIYKDFYDYSNASFHESESKILSANIKYNFDQQRLFIDKIDLLKAKLILDYQLTGQFSRYYKLSFEKSFPENDFFTGPVFEIGGGLSAYTKYAAVYGLGILGYSYHRENRVYAAPEIGVIFRGINHAKLISSITYRYDLINNVHKWYTLKFNTYIDLSFNKDRRIFFGFERYFGQNDKNRLILGCVINF